MSGFSSLAALASVASVATVWGDLQNILGGSSGQHVDFANHPDVFDVPARLRNLYPANNFNRDVTTTWWETSVLDGHAAESSLDIASQLRSATFVVLDKDFYKVSV